LSLLTLFTPFFSQTASAVTAADVLNRARAWSILNALIDGRDNVDNTIPLSDVSNCHIFGALDNNDVFVGHHSTGNNTVSTQNAFDGAAWNKLENNSGALTAALNSVGIEGGCRGLLETTGFTYSDGSMRIPADFGDRLSQRLRDALDPDAFFGANLGDSGPGDAISYAMLYYDLINVCGWEYRNAFNTQAPGDEGTRSREAEGNGWGGDADDRHFYTYTYENGKAGLNVYFKGRNGTRDDINVGPKSGFANSGDNDAQIDCGDNNADVVSAKLADNHRYADAYAALLKPGGSTTPGTCADRYPGSTGQTAACDAGFSHKNDPTYCSTTYPSGAEREACEYGRTTATGDSSSTTPLPGTEEAGTDKTTCAIELIGWIICPVVTFLSKITDGAYSIISGMLEVQPLNSTGESPLFNAWSVMRNFANIMFVIAFLVIIFSQITSIGISNYGIKKMLPKLIVAAILVNVSFWICAIAVDISNILGSSIYKVIMGVQGDVGPSLAETDSLATGKGWSAIAGPLLAGTLAVGAAFFVTLAVFLPMLVVVLATIVTVFLALILRQAFIIILIVLSPIAFVATLLPNTSSFAKNYFSIAKVLLMIYPVIGLVFAGSALASTIIMASSDLPYIQIVGAAVAIIPLVAAPALMKVINGIGSRFGLPNIGVKLDKMKKGAEGYRDYRKNIAQNRRFERAAGERGLGKFANRLGPEGSRRQRTARWLAGAGVTASQNKELRRQSVERAAKEGAQSYVVGRVAVPAGASAGAKQAAEAFAQKLAGPTGDVSKIKATAKAAQTEEFIKAVKAEKATMSQTGAGDISDLTKIPPDSLHGIMRDSKNSIERRAAAAGKLMEIGGDKDIHAALEYLGTTSDPGISSIQQQIASDMGSRKPISLGGTDIGALNTGSYSGGFDSKIASRLTAGKISAEALAKASPDELKRINDYVTDNAAALKAANPQAMAKLKSDIDAYRKNTAIAQPTPEIGGHMDTIGGLL
jgi:hypothetical protein